MDTTTTREAQEFSLTVRPGDLEGIDKYKEKIVKWLDDLCTHYCIAVEQKGDLSTQHFQCAIVTKLQHRADNLKKTLTGICGPDWSTDQKKHAICVNKNRKGNDIKLLAGGYCMKQDVAPLLKGWTQEELEPYVEKYDELKKRSEKANISRVSIVAILKDVHTEITDHKNPDVRDGFSRKDPRSKLTTMFRYAIAQGCDLQRYSTPVWINYLVSNFDVLFRDVTADDILKELSEPYV